MLHLTVSLLGRPHLSVDGVPLTSLPIRALPLLAYLSLTGLAQPRETIANLLWSDSDYTHGLAALRTTLWRLKSLGFDQWLLVENDQVSLDNLNTIKVDVLEFRKKIEACKAHGHANSQVCLMCIPNLTEAAELYQGEFLSGINFSKAPVFDEWRLQEGEVLRETYIDVLERLTRGHRMLGDFDLSIQSAQLLLRQDRYNETAHFNLIQLYSLTGQRSAAINQYKRYKDFLYDELGVEPSPEISELYKQILRGADTALVTHRDQTPVFLVADIENVQSLCKQDANKKAEIIFIYHKILKETASRFGGYIIQKSESNVTLLFEKGQPLHCAATIHLKLNKTRWGNGDMPAVRMVLYSPALDDGAGHDFSAVTRDASTLLSMTWGGQVIFTEKTLKVLDQPPGSKIKDLGFYSIRDSAPAVHVLELIHPHIPGSNQSTLRSGNSHPVNFPRLAPEFLGREAELNELASLIQQSDARLITLIGPGGTGKTRLAVQSAEMNASHFPDGAFFIPLASLQNADYIPIALAQALNFSFYGTRDHIDQVIAHLHRMKVLLVFDNFEHLRTKGVEFITHLLSNSHFLKILITSRERLNLISEYLMEINGLPVPETDQVSDITSYSSIQLFIRNAKKINPKFDPVNQITDIIRICQLLNGLPLGIILASAWVRVHSCQFIAEQVAQDLDFLTLSSPDIPHRHRSLRVVLDNSWQLLSDEERLSLSRLSIFPASFSMQAAQEICETTSIQLISFLDKSLLVRRNERFEMLDTYRQYTAQKLDDYIGERDRLRSEFQEFFCMFYETRYESLIGPDQRRALDEMISDFDNLRSAWNWMIETNRWDLVGRMIASIQTYHIFTGQYVQGREFFESALKKLAQLNDPSLLELSQTLTMYDAWLMTRNGFTARGSEILLACLEAFQASGAQRNLVLSQMFLAEACRLQGFCDQGKRYILNALDIIQVDSVPSNNLTTSVMANCYATLGAIQLDLGEFDQALINLEHSYSTLLELHAYCESIQPLLNLGKLSLIQGEFVHARDLFLQALETAENMYDPRGLAIIHNNLAEVYQLITNPAESYNHLTTALKYCRETGDRRMTAVILNNLAYHHRRFLGNYTESIHLYHQCIQIFNELGDLRGVAYSYYDLARAYHGMGLIKETWEYCLRSLQTAMTLDSVPLILHALHAYAAITAHNGDRERGLRVCYLITNHPQTQPDTRKRVIVTRSRMELELSDEVINDAVRWGKSANLYDVVDQILMNANP